MLFLSCLAEKKSLFLLSTYWHKNLHNIFCLQVQKNILLSTYWHKNMMNFTKIWDPVFDPHGIVIWVFFRWIFNVNGYVGNKRSTRVDQNYYHQKDLIVSYKKHYCHFLIRHILFSISSFLCRGYATSPLENLAFISSFLSLRLSLNCRVRWTWMINWWDFASM